MSELPPLPLTRAEEAGKKQVRLVRAAARIAVVRQCNNERICLFVLHQTKGLELPGGAIEAGESPQQAGLRELREEAGIQLLHDQPLSLIDMIPIIDHRGGNWLDIIYGAKASPSQLILHWEAELAVHWLNVRQIKELVDPQLSSYNASLKAISATELWQNQDENASSK